ncbi:hypothetical protein QBC40DRAFT_350626 [Triangularia verruculosa]|uniref:Uncharacterized protein n=1 Tax=Triangularia verruculosa TaxID=2587418 RepID=A0AAN6XD54_9PEZI|nr:hypothetical protein QBC40DRAFT_350626 [Triangularia verruculosa]
MAALDLGNGGARCNVPLLGRVDESASEQQWALAKHSICGNMSAGIRKPALDMEWSDHAATLPELGKRTWKEVVEMPTAPSTGNRNQLRVGDFGACHRMSLGRSGWTAGWMAAGVDEGAENPSQPMNDFPTYPAPAAGEKNRPCHPTSGPEPVLPSSQQVWLSILVMPIPSTSEKRAEPLVERCGSVHRSHMDIQPASRNRGSKPSLPSCPSKLLVAATRSVESSVRSSSCGHVGGRVVRIHVLMVNKASCNQKCCATAGQRESWPMEHLGRRRNMEEGFRFATSPCRVAVVDGYCVLWISEKGRRMGLLGPLQGRGRRRLSRRSIVLHVTMVAHRSGFNLGRKMKGGYSGGVVETHNRLHRRAQQLLFLPHRGEDELSHVSLCRQFWGRRRRILAACAEEMEGRNERRRRGS